MYACDYVAALQSLVTVGLNGMKRLLFVIEPAYPSSLRYRCPQADDLIVCGVSVVDIVTDTAPLFTNWYLLPILA
jgi:hypothetical protein